MLLIMILLSKIPAFHLFVKTLSPIYFKYSKKPKPRVYSGYNFLSNAPRYLQDCIGEPRNSL